MSGQGYSTDRMPQIEQQRIALCANMDALAKSMRDTAAIADTCKLALLNWNLKPDASSPAWSPDIQQVMSALNNQAAALQTPSKRKYTRHNVDGDEGDGRRRKRKTKDPNAPKRPASSYLIFQNEIRRSLKAKNPLMANNELLATISKMWQEMPENEKARYEDKMKVQKERYAKEKAAYDLKQTGDPLSSVPTTPAIIAPVAPAVVVATEGTSEEDEEEEEEEESPQAEAEAEVEAPSEESEGSDDDDDEDEALEPPAKKSKKEKDDSKPKKVNA